MVRIDAYHKSFPPYHGKDTACRQFCKRIVASV